MLIWSYDKSFEGLLTLVFECYELHTFPDKITGENNTISYLFTDSYRIITDEKKAKRVWNGLHKKVSAQSCQMLYYAYLSEYQDIELLILHYIQKAFATTYNIETDFGDLNILLLNKLKQKVAREAERVRMFVRFQKTLDNMYYASFDPMYNVLPLITEHFEKRFADQQWILYDTQRNYGFYYNLQKTAEVRFSESMIHGATGQIDKSIMAEDEAKFQSMWKNYYDVLCIKERINPKLHVQLLPKRFWKYLPEKQNHLKK